MKKTLVVLLALVLVFAFATTAYAADTQYTPYTDIADQDVDTQTAIERLSILGALKGYNAEGTIYAPANLITREEFATIGVRVAGLEDQVALYASLASAFKDVEEGRWSEGYINCANANGIMIGRGTGLFDPKANVTMQEVVTVLLRAVGYTDQLPGSWPTDYNRKAVNIGLTEYVDFIGPKYATRGEVAALVNEAVDLWIVYYVDNEIAQGIGQIGWGDPEDRLLVDEDGFAYKIFKTNEEGNGFWEANNYGSLLNETFDCVEGSELVFNDGDDVKSEATGWGIVDFDDWELEAYFSDVIFDSESGYELAEDYTNEFATLYGISGGQDVTDLGWQVADITFNSDDEIVYIDLNSEITRTAAVEDDYEAAWLTTVDLLEDNDDYGEIWYYDWTGKGAKSAVNYYAVKDFSDFAGDGYHIVTSIDDDEWECYATESYDFDDEAVYYLMGTGFITAADLEVNDVAYEIFLNGADDNMFLVFRPAEGTLDDYGNDFIEFDDVDYNDVNSRFSIDKGDTIEEYVTDTVYDVDFSDTIFMAPAYSFIDFSYFYDNLQMYNYGVIDSYIYGRNSTTDRIAGTTRDTATGINILLPGDTELTAINFEDAYDEADFDTLPAEGSLVNLTLNADGECTAIQDNGVDFDEATLNVLDLPGDAVRGDAVGSWTSKGRLAMLINTDGDPDIEIDDTYTFADDAVIYLVESDEDDATLYDFDSVQCLSYEDFKALGDFTFADICIYEADGREISKLYVRDLDEEADEAYGFGLYTGQGARSISLDAYYLVIGGKVVLVDEDVFRDADLDTGFIAYMTSDGEIEVGDYLLFTDDGDVTAASVTAFNDPANDWADEFDMTADTGDVTEVLDNDITLDIPITLFFGDLLASYNFDTDDAVDFDEDVLVGENALVFYDSDSENDLLYLLISVGDVTP